MAPPSARFRRPLDDSMLVRLALMSGLASVEDVQEFYRLERLPTGKPASFEEFLKSKGVEAARFDVVRRAYIETSDFGVHAIEYCRERGIGEEALARLEKALADCETQQLLLVREGGSPPRIGEMLVERGLIRRSSLGEIVRRQGMVGRLARYDEEARAQRKPLARLGLLDANGRVRRGRAALSGALLALTLAAVAVAVWPRHSRDPIFGHLSGPEAGGEALAAHDANVLGHYDNLLRALKERRHADAEDYRRRLRAYFAALKRAGVDLAGEDARRWREDRHRPDVVRAREITARLERIRTAFERIDAHRARAIPDAEMARMTLEELEARVLPPEGEGP